MKRYISILLLCMTALLSHAELSNDQKRLRINIVTALKEAGYKPQISADDLSFTKDGEKYWVTIDPNSESPYLISIYTDHSYDADKFTTRNNVEACASVVNLQYKTAKLHCKAREYQIRTDLMIKDIDAFKVALDNILSEQIKANNYINETVASDLRGVDLTGNKDNLYDKAYELYENGNYFPAFKLFNILADNDYPAAYIMLGVMYERGQGVTHNEDLMVQNYEKAIRNKLNDGSYALGKYFYKKKDYAKALDYLTQNSSESSGNAFRSDSYFLIGQMYEKGQGVDENLFTAINYYKDALEYSTELESDARLALMRLNEPVENIADFVDIPKSILRDLSFEDMYNTGYAYENGESPRPVSLPKAYGYYKAAVQKDKNSAKANMKMGDIYISKYYPFNDKATSDKYYKKAFDIYKRQEGISADANYQIARMYKEGLGVQANPDMAQKYFENAAAKGNFEADYELGLIFKGVDDVRAFSRFQKAASKGIAPAMLEVAKAYQDGTGVSSNREEAIAWYKKCADTDTSYAKEAAAALEKMGFTDDDKE